MADRVLKRSESADDVKVKEDQWAKTNRVPQYIATIIVDILQLIYGLGIGWSSIALPVLAEPEEEGAVPITLEEGSWLTSILYISAVPSMPAYGYICEKFGRKACGYLIGVPYLASAVLQRAATNFGAMQAARALLGLASGGIFVFAPLYVSEIAEDVLRGRLGAFVTLMRNIGILIAYVSGTFLSYRHFEILCVVPPIVFLVTFYWLPETPIFLLRCRKEEEAQKSLQWFRGKGVDTSREMAQIKAGLTAMNSEGSASATLRDLLATRGSRKAVFTGLLMSCNQQLCGFFGVASYTFMIFKESAPGLRDASNVILGLMLVVSMAVSMTIYDKVPRKVLLLLSNVIMVASLGVLSAYFFFREHDHDVTKFGWLPVTSLSTFIVGYSIGLAALPIVILTEIFSPKVRNLGLTTNGVFTWFLIFIVTKTFPMLTEKIGFYGTCWVYIFWCLVGVVVIVILLPETKNRDLKSILLELEGKEPCEASEVMKEIDEKSLPLVENRV